MYLRTKTTRSFNAGRGLVLDSKAEKEANSRLGSLVLGVVDRCISRKANWGCMILGQGLGRTAVAAVRVWVWDCKMSGWMMVRSGTFVMKKALAGGGPCWMATMRCSQTDVVRRWGRSMAAQQ